MGPVEWLEGLTDEQHHEIFKAPVGQWGLLFTLKRDHETCTRWFCGARDLIIIEE